MHDSLVQILVASFTRHTSSFSCPAGTSKVWSANLAPSALISANYTGRQGIKAALVNLILSCLPPSARL